MSMIDEPRRDDADDISLRFRQLLTRYRRTGAAAVIAELMARPSDADFSMIRTSRIVAARKLLLS